MLKVLYFVLKMDLCLNTRQSTIVFGKNGVEFWNFIEKISIEQNLLEDIRTNSSFIEWLTKLDNDKVENAHIIDLMNEYREKEKIINNEIWA